MHLKDQRKPLQLDELAKKNEERKCDLVGMLESAVEAMDRAILMEVHRSS